MAPNKSRPKAAAMIGLQVLRKIFVGFMGCSFLLYKVFGEVF